MIEGSGNPSSFVCVDVGARGQLQPMWETYTGDEFPWFRAVLFEPEPYAASELRRRYRGAGRVAVMEKALADREGPRELFVTYHDTCSSLLEPNLEFLDHYNIAPIFKVVGKLAVQCVTLDQLVEGSEMPSPHFVKIDVQGAEHLVLQGMQHCLKTCIGLELESHLYRIYKEQGLLCDIVAILEKQGLYLRDLIPQRNFDTDFVEANAVFCRRRSELSELEDLRRLELIERVYQFPTWPNGAMIKQSLANA